MKNIKEEKHYVRVLLEGEHLHMFEEVKKILGITADTEVCRHALKILHEKLLKERGKEPQ